MENNEKQELENESQTNETPIQEFEKAETKSKKSKKPIFKKWWFWLIIAGAVISMISGFSNKNDADKQGTGGTLGAPTNNKCIHSYVLKTSEATCTTGGYDTYMCSFCQDIKTEYKISLGHTTTEGTCSRCGESFGTWKSSFYVDEFDNPTNEAYISNSNYFYGTFSNRATTDSKLCALVLIDAEKICIKLWEYGSQEVKAYSNTNYKITILDDDGNKHYTNGTMYKNGERIRLTDWTLVNLLYDNEHLKIYIQENSEYGVNSTYLFSITNGNFNSVYYDFYYKYMD